MRLDIINFLKGDVLGRIILCPARRTNHVYNLQFRQDVMAGMQNLACEDKRRVVLSYEQANVKCRIPVAEKLTNSPFRV